MRRRCNEMKLQFLEYFYYPILLDSKQKDHQNNRDAAIPTSTSISSQLKARATKKARAARAQ